jgi:glutathione S-transferase
MLLHDNPRSSNAQKVRFLLAELDLEHERIEVPFGADRPEWHRAVNPVGGIPALVDGDLRLAESNTILRYLAAREGREDLYPVALRARSQVDWLLDSIGMTMRPLSLQVEMQAFGLRPGRGLFAEEPDPAAAEEALQSVAPRLEAFAALLDPASPWACLGRFTIADVAAAPMLHRLQRADVDLAGAVPRLTAWAEAVCARPAWQPVAEEAGV